MSKIIVDYYDGAYGPTIHVEVPDTTLMGYLLELVRSLTTVGRIVDLTSLEFVTLKNIDAFIWKSEEISRWSFEDKVLFRSKSKPICSSFRWVKPPNGWKDSLEWLNGLSGPGHQYLTVEGTDDALVEVSFLERR